MRPDLPQGCPGSRTRITRSGRKGRPCRSTAVGGAERLDWFHGVYAKAPTLLGRSELGRSCVAGGAIVRLKRDNAAIIDVPSQFGSVMPKTMVLPSQSDTCCSEGAGNAPGKARWPKPAGCSIAWLTSAWCCESARPPDPRSRRPPRARRRWSRSPDFPHAAQSGACCGESA